LSKNVVLIGMPGCGKTTIGRLIAKKLKIKFVDVDEYIVEKNNSTINDLFQRGEEFFRNLEEIAIVELSFKSNIVIATGGGVIKNYSNIESLHKSGVIIFIDRPIKEIINDIVVENRPLLKSGVSNIEELYKERHLLYTNYADYVVSNDGGVDAVVNNVVRLLEIENNG
jgi:shikimate kinase